MNEKELRELQLYGLEILTAVDSFCRENNIKYFLGEGTLLGAVRHKGFIPWDDDVDVLMLREDFDKFISTFSIPGYELAYFNALPVWLHYFAKVKMLKETKFNTRVNKKIKGSTGPRIDIFPLDYVPMLESKEQNLIEKKVLFWKRCLFNKCIPLKKKKHITGYMMMIGSRLIPYDYVVNKLKKYATLYNKDNCEYVINYGSAYRACKETFPLYMFEKTIDVPFEDKLFMISPYYDEILKKIYGNYMELPPIEKRCVKHPVYVRNDGNEKS